MTYFDELHFHKNESSPTIIFLAQTVSRAKTKILLLKISAKIALKENIARTFGFEQIVKSFQS